MKLADVLRDVPVVSMSGSNDVEITSVTSDSRLVRKGSLFVAIPGTAQDGAKFIPQAIEKGAAAVVGAKEPAPSEREGASRRAEGEAVWVEVQDPRSALALTAANFYNRPADKLTLVGVTGTSGKTTTAKMVESIFDATNEPAGLIGTIEYRAGKERLSADRTTPDAVVLQEWFAKMRDAGVRNAVMEVSSHALALKRTHGIRFAAAIFTNLSRDHFDFHKDFDDYFAAKRILFDQIDKSKKTAIVNIDDTYGAKLAKELGKAVVSIGRSTNADIHPAKDFVIDVRGLRGTLNTPSGSIRIESALLGLPNLYNWMGAIGGALAVGIPLKAIEAGVRNLTSVRGRFERVATNDGPTVIVDYAHKPDALEKLLHAVREIAAGRRVVLLVGCGGDRDKGKRPEMAAIAGRLADYTILTSDNPRSEKPEAILDEMERGMKDVAREKYTRMADRRAAIEKAIEESSADDVVVIAGKGHETYQVIGDEVNHFDDREEAELALKKRAHKSISKVS